jgi:hypothetical protein
MAPLPWRKYSVPGLRLINQALSAPWSRLLGLVATLGVGMLLLTVLLRQPLSVTTEIGGRSDSPWLGTGFYSKEISTNGLYRWTNGLATIHLPATNAVYAVTIQASTGLITAPQQVFVEEHGRPIVNFEIGSDFRDYTFIWRPDGRRQWFRGDSSLDLTFNTETRDFAGGDQRPLGMVVKKLALHSAGGLALAPFGWLGLTILALWLLIRPAKRRAWLLFAALSLGLLLAYVGLAWRPLSTVSVWVPLMALPALATLSLWGLALARWQPAGGWRSALPALGLLGLLAALLISVTLQWYVEGPDYVWHVNHGSSLPSVFRAHDFYPLGFPLILWLGANLGGDPLFAGRLAALLSTVAVSGLTALLAWRMVGSRAAAISLLLLLASPVLLAYGIFASTDSVQLLPLTGAIVILLWNPQLSRRRVFWAGLVLGIAYLFRFQALMMLVLIGLWMVFQPLPAPQRWLNQPALRRAAFLFGFGLFFLGFVAGSAPQWVFDIRDHGRPFYSLQYENIWQAAYARTDPVAPAAVGLQLNPPPADTGVLDIVAFDPYALFRHWFGNLQEFLSKTIHQLFIWPLGLLVMLAVALALGRSGNPRLALLVLLALSYVPIIALTWNKDRFYLPLVPLLAVLGAWLIETLRARPLHLGRLTLTPGTLAQVLLVIWVLRNLGALEALLPTYGRLIIGL